jgi:hypothetical protein
MTEKAPIFVTGVERSGASIVAKIFSMCGAYTGEVNVMQENKQLKEMTHDYLLESPLNDLMLPIDYLYIPVSWKRQVERIIANQGIKEKSQWMYKDSQLAQTWPVWNFAFPNAKWIIVRRRTGDIIQSCIKTGFMTMFKSQENRDKINVIDESSGWLWWVHEYEKRFVQMIEAGVNCKIVWPERMVMGDYQQIHETLDWLGLKWNSEVFKVIDPMLEKSRRI